MPSTIEITFTGIPNDGDKILLNPSDPVFGVVEEVFRPFRSGPKTVEIGIINPGQNAIGFITSFRTDFDTFDDFSDSFSLPQNYTITHNNKENYFDNASISGSFASIVSVGSTSPPVIPEIQDLSFIGGGVACDQLRPVFTYNQQLDLIEIKSPLGNVLQSVPNPLNPFTSLLNLNRGTGIGLSVEATIGSETIINNIPVPSSININAITQRFTPNGYVVTIDLVNRTVGGAVVEYSIDNITWQLSNQFSGLLPGNFTFYARDQYGCNKQQDFVLIDDGSSAIKPEPFFEISELNSFHFALQEQDKKYENYQNTLSHQEEANLFCRKFQHLINKSDPIIGVQFRSNYDLNVVTLVDEQNNQTNIPIFKRSNNLNIFDVRDGFLTDVGSGIVGVYFNGGNTYNPNDNSVLGINSFVEDLPPFYNTGEFIKLDDLGWYQIIEIRFLEDKNAWVAITSYTTTPFITDVPKIVTYNYNQQNYETYEFPIDFSTYEGRYVICIEISNAGDVENITYLSEWINVQESHSKTFEIRFSNTENNEINYATGIFHFLRLEYIRQKHYLNDKTIEVNRTDTQISHLEAKITDKFVFDLRPIPTAIRIKLTRSLSLDEVFIDGVGYVFEDDYESEVLGQTNFYKFRAIGTPNNKQFNTKSNAQILENIQVNSGLIEVGDNEGFIKLNNI